MTSESDPVLYKLRPELEYSTQTQQGQSFVVARDPVAERYFRFPESQAVILKLLRTPVDVHTLRERASQRLGAEVPADTVRKFLASLEARQLLDTPQCRAKLAQLAERKPKDRNWLYLRLVSLDAQTLFDWLAPRTRWCFTPAFHVFAAAMILTGIVITTIHAGTLARSALSLLSVNGIILIWLVIVGVGVLHELAHGLTCRHFGGRVREVGFMLIYFQPAFYCDVSDAWMFPSRRERLWVTFAGGYFQLVLWGMAVIVWRIFVEDSLINWIAMTVVVFSGLQTLVNFNPLIKLDGYYMLSDYLEIPNLRAKALRAVQARIAGEDDPLLASGERRSLVTFGALSLTFSTLLLAVVYVNIYVLATSYFAFAGLTAFALFAGLTLRRTAAEQAAGAGALMSRASLRKYRNLIIAGVFLLLTFVVPWKLRIPAEFTIQPGQEVAVRAPIAGIVEEMLVREGEKVHRGQEVAYLHNSELREQLTVLTGQWNSKNAELQRLEAGPRQEQIERARQLVATRQQELANVRRNEQDRIALERQLEAIEAEVRRAEVQAESLATLFEEELAPRNSALDAQEELNAAQARHAAMKAQIEAFDESNDREEDLKRAQLREAERDLDLLLAGARADEIAQARDEAANLYAQMMDVSHELRTGTIVSPISGRIVTPDLRLLEGETVSAGHELMEIQSTGMVRAELWVAEKDLADVHVDSPIRLVANAFPGRTFEGRVGQIAETAQEIDGKTVVRATAELENEDGALLADMTGHAKIDAGWHPVIHLMTRRLIRWINTEFWHLMP